jgi:hypothetical protein
MRARGFSPAVTSAGVIGSPETPLYFAFIVSASNSGSHSCQTSSVSTTMSSAWIIYSRRKASTSAREADLSFRGEVTMFRTCMISPFGCTVDETQTSVRGWQLLLPIGRAIEIDSRRPSIVTPFDQPPPKSAARSRRVARSGTGDLPYLDGLGAHALGHEALEVRIDRAVRGRNGVIARL